MTLLVVDLRAPAAQLVHSEQDLWRGLIALAPRRVSVGSHDRPFSTALLAEHTQYRMALLVLLG